MPSYNRVGIGAAFVPYARTIRYVITGVTKDSTGAVLPNCEVDAYETNTDCHRGRVTSNDIGVYEIHVSGTPEDRFYARAYLSGAPDVAGTTVNTLVSVER